jgi:CBS-domain-containing membrane protein
MAHAIRGERTSSRPQARHYLIQSTLAGVFVAGAFLLTRDAAHLAAVVSLGSTAFVVFTLPGSVAAGARNAIGGHWFSAAVGVVGSLILPRLWSQLPLTELLIVGLAVGAAALVMAVTVAASVRFCRPASACLSCRIAASSPRPRPERRP